MKLLRAGASAGLLTAALALAACGSDSNTTASTQGPTGGSSTSGTSSAGATACTGAGDLTASGSTAQANAMTAWIAAYQKACGKTVQYGGGGSGQGVTDFTNGKVDFAGSDSALDASKGEIAKAAAACGSAAYDLPMVTGPIAVAFKLNGVTDLTLKPDTIAKIFTGKITTWDNTEIKGENSTAKLPSTKITVFYRGDQSGTTNNFEKYLAAAAPTIYTAKPSKTWVGVGQGKTGSQGVQQAIGSTDGGIGYVELSYANSGGLSKAKIDSGSGAVELNAQSVAAAVAAATPAPNGAGDLTLKLAYDTKAAGAYPIILVTYEIVCSKYKDAAKGAAVKAFLTYTSSQAGQDLLTDQGSAPLPASVLTQVQASVAKIS